MTISSKDMNTQARSYADRIRSAETVYGQTLSDEMFNLGEALYSKSKEAGGAIVSPEAWVAWMRKARIVTVKFNKVVEVDDVGLWWLEKIFAEFHGAIARHYDTQIWYKHGKDYHDLANYATRKEKSAEDVAYAERCFAEMRRNMARFLENTKIIKGKRTDVKGNYVDTGEVAV